MKHKREFVEALRSGKYTQTKNRLHDSRGFCCLGVACDISNTGYWGSSTITSATLCYRHNDGSMAGGLLTRAVANWLGLDPFNTSLLVPELYGSMDNGQILDPRDDISRNEDTCQVTLISLNDDFGLNFDQIADVIDYFFEDEDAE